MSTYRPLIELAPAWILVDGRICGIAFRCPIHDRVPGNEDFPCMHRIGFTNPPDGQPPPVGRWRITWERRAGDTFETLALSPSIRNRGYADGGGCHWHGFIGGQQGDRPGIVETLGDSK
jgi:hypothetical protein